MYLFFDNRFFYESGFWVFEEDWNTEICWMGQNAGKAQEIVIELQNVNEDRFLKKSASWIVSFKSLYLTYSSWNHLNSI